MAAIQPEITSLITIWTMNKSQMVDWMIRYGGWPPQAGQLTYSSADLRWYVLRCFISLARLDPRDLPLAAAFNSETRYVWPPLPQLIRGVDINKMKLDQVEPAISLLRGEEVAMFIVCRFLSHLDQTSQYFNQSKPIYELPPPRPTVRGPNGGFIVDSTLQGIIWSEHATPEMKLQGLALLVDLEMSLIGHMGRWRSFRVRHETEVKGTLGETWKKVLNSPDGTKEGYKMLRVFYDRFDSINSDFRHLVETAYPGSIEPTPAGLIVGVSNILQAYLSQDLVQLPPSAQTYLGYVNRVLLNYRAYGTAGLRGSNLMEGDPVFSRADTSILPVISKMGLPTPTVTAGLIDSYLAKVPTDAIIMQRLAKLA